MEPAIFSGPRGLDPKECLMSSFLSSFPKKVLNAFFILVFMAAILSCDTNGSTTNDNSNVPGSLPASLQGEWGFIPPGSSEPADLYIIDSTTLHYVYDDPEWGSYGYQGNILFVSNYSSSSGIIIIEYTNGASDPSKPFAGIYYRNLTSNTVQLANAINPDYSSPDTATLSEAKEKFTQNSIGNYVAMWGTYTK